MLTRVQKWGNSQGLRFTKVILEEADMKVGDAVRVSVKGRKIVIEPVEQGRRKYELKALVARMPKDYRVEEVDWGSPVRKEAW
jgi:antitoxin MazE